MFKTFQRVRPLLFGSLGLLSQVDIVAGATGEAGEFVTQSSLIGKVAWRWECSGDSIGTKSREPATVLVLVHGFGGSGAGVLDAQWRTFASENKLILLAPTFRSVQTKEREGAAYYYPELGSGAALLAARAQLGRLSWAVVWRQSASVRRIGGGGPGVPPNRASRLFAGIQELQGEVEEVSEGGNERCNIGEGGGVENPVDPGRFTSGTDHSHLAENHFGAF